ncbi:hypothetical protein C8R43DRAFT_941701 [Mycena crocata]|nr:hypothetical protein C8R43DRAFT_941701 [Mycena crocata]
MHYYPYHWLQTTGNNALCPAAITGRNALKWSVWRVYYDARKEMVKENPEPTTLQKHALEQYCMPILFKNVWQRMVQDPNEVKYNQAFWVTVGRPMYRDPEPALAAYIMRWNRYTDGCPCEDNYQTLDLRKVRGLAIWNVLMPARPKTGSIPDEVRNSMIAITKSLWNVLGCPYNYRQTLKSGNITPALELNLEPFPLTSAGEMTDAMIIQKLADMNLRSEDVDDAWLFVRTMILSIKDKPRPGWDHKEVELYVQHSAIAEGSTEPLGKTPPNGNVFTRPPGLLWHHSDNNNAFHKGLFIGDIPLDIPLGSQMSGRFSMTKPSTWAPSYKSQSSEYVSSASGSLSGSTSGGSVGSYGTGLLRGTFGGRRHMGYHGRGATSIRSGYRGGPRGGGNFVQHR